MSVSCRQHLITGSQPVHFSWTEPEEKAPSTKWLIYTRHMALQCSVCLLCCLQRGIKCASDILCVKDRVKRCLPLPLMLLADLSGERDTLLAAQAQFYQSGLSRIPKWQKVCRKFTPPLLKHENKALLLALFSPRQSTKTQSYSEVSWWERCLFGLSHLERKHASLSQFRICPIGQKSFAEWIS